MRKGVDYRGKEWEENSKPMKPDKDLTGQTFGRLNVLFRVQNDLQGSSLWLAECSCGHTVVVKGASLRNGHTTSCGCAQKDIVSAKLTKPFELGEQIGYLTVIGKADGYMGKGAYWHVRCKCGKERVVQAEALRNGTTVSCGCYQREIASECNLIDLSGMRFGMLQVMTRSNKKVSYGDVYWMCQCDCGNVVEASGHSLRRGSVLSCGCLNMSHGEYYISNILHLNDIDYIYDRAYFDDLKNEDGNLLRYDFILLNNNLPYRIVEFDGNQHDEPVEFFGGIESFEKLQHNDLIKNQYALSHNIPLVRIPYSKKDTITIEDLLGDKYLIKGEI